MQHVEYTGTLIGVARRARGMTQLDLARAASVSQGWLSRAEAGHVDVDRDRIRRLAEATRYPVELFRSDVEAPTPIAACVHTRKRANASVAQFGRMRAELALLHIWIQRLFGSVPMTLEPESPTPDGFVSPEEIARRVRSHLGAHAGPVENLVEFVESSGTVVVQRALGHERIDALSSWPEHHRPIILLDQAMPTARRRFTLAHEVGHLVMHPTPTDAQETEADSFASELLMPASAIRDELDAPLTVAKLMLLKTRWGVSIAALIRRARDLDTVSDRQYKSLNIELAKAGYRQAEPGELQPETPRLVTDRVRDLIQGGCSEAEIASSALMSESELRALFAPPEVMTP